jgi:hypothetical protein
MKLVLQTYNGTSITAYSAKIIKGSHIVKAKIIDVERVSDNVAYGGKSFEPRTFEIIFTFRQSTANFNTDAEAVGKLFNTRDTVLRTLVANDTNDSNTPYYIECTPIEWKPIEAGTQKIVMWTNDPVWKKVTASTDTESVAGSGTTAMTVTNNGNVDTYPSIAITPTATGGAYSYRRHSIVYNPIAYANPNYPLEITGGGIDTNALAKDTTVSNQINEVAGISDSATTWAIDTSVGGGLPTGGGVFMVDNEQCSYTSIAAGTISGVVRGINGTTATTHANNAVMTRSLIQANGNDIRVIVNGVEVPRWLGGTVYSDTTLKVWSVFNFPARIQMTLGAAISGASGVTTITIANNTANIAAMKLLPDRGIIYIDTEAIAYTAKNVTARTLTIADNGRGIKDTTAATHSNGATVRHIPFDIVVQYGNLSADTLVQDETRKPCFSLENSTNTNWRYDSADSVFGDIAGLRSGAWKPSLPKGKFSNWFTGHDATFGTDPITELGAEITTYLSGLLYKAETAEINWTFFNPAGITSISSLGEKYKLNSTTPFPTCRLQSAKVNQVYVNEWAETTPASANTWTAWTRASETVPTGTMYLRFQFTGAVKGGSAIDYARNQVLLGSAGSMGVSFESTGVPQVTLKSQATNAHINVAMTNTTTGEGIEFSFPLAANTTLTIDTEARTVSYQDRLLAPVEWIGSKSNRQDWFRLVPGTNSINYVDSSTGACTVVFTYKERKNL